MSGGPSESQAPAPEPPGGLIPLAVRGGEAENLGKGLPLGFVVGFELRLVQAVWNRARAIDKLGKPLALASEALSSIMPRDGDYKTYPSKVVQSLRGRCITLSSLNAKLGAPRAPIVAQLPTMAGNMFTLS